jgi:hypothetical protein
VTLVIGKYHAAGNYDAQMGRVKKIRLEALISFGS